MPLSDDERKLMNAISPQHMELASPFLWAVDRAGFDWETGKPMLQSFLDRKLIWDLNGDTLEDPLGICDRTRAGDLEMGVYISITSLGGNLYRIQCPQTEREWRDGVDGRFVDVVGLEIARRRALNGMGFTGVNIVEIAPDGAVEVIGSVRNRYEISNANRPPVPPREPPVYLEPIPKNHAEMFERLAANSEAD